jgi:hypothetical protein
MGDIRLGLQTSKLHDKHGNANREFFKGGRRGICMRGRWTVLDTAFVYYLLFFMQKLDFARGCVMRKPYEINNGRGVMISENTVLDLEGRCSIQLSYGRSRKDITGGSRPAQARLSGGVTPVSDRVA